MASDPTSSARPTLCQAIKPLVSPPLFHQLSPSLLLPLHFSDVSVPQASGELHFPPTRPSPAGPRAPQKIRRSQSEECRPARLLVVICSRSRQHSLVNCLAVGPPSVVTKDDA